MREIFVPLCEKFRPELFAVSAGFDAHFDDPLTGLRLSTEAYGWLTTMVITQAEKFCEGKVVFLLEGGYDLEALAGGVVLCGQGNAGGKIPSSGGENEAEVNR
jgi:acetoin utilization deacetylase AcuC-like enzyme